MEASANRTDFTSALFLGEYHPSSGIRPWSRLTTGVPAVLRESATATLLASVVARRQRAEAGLVERSALHALTDVLSAFPERGGTLWVDAAAYPLTRMACLVARARGIEVCRYRHHDPPDRLPPRSWLVTDGWCQGCNRPAPLDHLAGLARCAGGRVVVDDSLAFGVLGARGPGTGPFGDGTGTVRWLGADHTNTLWLASLAKAHGVPVTVMTGDRRTVTAVARHGSHRMHSSPPSEADLAAGLDSLGRPAELARRRRHLHHLTAQLRDGFRTLGMTPVGRTFPIVATRLHSAAAAQRILAATAQDGWQVIVQVPRCAPGHQLATVVRSDHRPEDIERLLQTLRRATAGRLVA